MNLRRLGAPDLAPTAFTTDVSVFVPAFHTGYKRVVSAVSKIYHFICNNTGYWMFLFYFDMCNCKHVNNLLHLLLIDLDGLVFRLHNSLKI